MAKGILGKKVGMTQVFAKDGSVVPVTVIETTPSVVLQKKTVETDGYVAVQLGYEDKKKFTKPEEGHAKKANTTPKRFIVEIAGEEMLAFNVGDSVKASIFKEGEVVDITGTSKGKGFQGTVKRYNMHIGPKAHGSKYHRGIGGNAVDYARMFKGRHMPGRMGGEKTTIQNLEIVKIDLQNNLMLIKGNVPGARKGYVVIRSAVKRGSHALNNEAQA